MAGFDWQLLVGTVSGVLAVVLVSTVAQRFGWSYSPIGGPGLLGLLTGLAAAAGILWAFGGG